jgi:hypothetical protein
MSYPGANLSELAPALANRGVTQFQNSSLIPRCPHFGTKEDHIQLLNAAVKVIETFANCPPLQPFSRPILWHRDLHLGNIFVSPGDPTTIVGIIDWQFVSAMPAFMQLQWSSFLRPPKDYESGLVKPRLPPDFNEMDPDEKAHAESERDQALLAKCYEVTLAHRSPEVYSALTEVDTPVQDLFPLVNRAWMDDVVPLRDSLLQISKNWHHTGIRGLCPYMVTPEDIFKHNIELSRFEDWQTLKGYTQELLQTGDDSWVNPRLDFDKAKARHDELLQIYMERETRVMSEEEARDLWFYIERT